MKMQKTNGYSTRYTKTKKTTKHTQEKHTWNQIFNRRFGPELKYKIQPKFPMTSRLPIFKLQNLNFRANIPL
jgi:hypothetical protein